VKYRIGTDPETGKPIYKRDSGFATKKAALQHGREQEADIRRGKWHDRRKGEITLDEYWQKWLVSYDTSDRNLLVRQAHYRNHLKPRWGCTPLNEIDPIDVAAFEKEKRAKYSSKYANGIMELLRMLMEDAAFARLIEFTPVRAKSRRGVKAPPTTRVGRVTDIPTVMAVCARLPEPEALMTLTALFTGMRWGEVIGVRVVPGAVPRRQRQAGARPLHHRQGRRRGPRDQRPEILRVAEGPQGPRRRVAAFPG
jgi:integrase